MLNFYVGEDLLIQTKFPWIPTQGTLIDYLDYESSQTTQYTVQDIRLEMTEQPAIEPSSAAGGKPQRASIRICVEIAVE